MRTLKAYIAIYCLLVVLSSCEVNSKTIISSVSSNTWNNGNQAKCDLLNPFLKELYEIEKFKRPKFNNYDCKTEWDTYGSCCRADELKIYAHRDIEDIKRSVDNVQSQALEMKKALKKIQDMLEIIAHLPTSTNIPFNFRAIIIRAQSLYNSENIKSFFSLLKGFMESKKEEDKFKEDNKRCWDWMASKRSSALCDFCSGRSDEFFYQDKTIVSKQLCMNFAAHCLDSLETLSEITAIAGMYVDISSLLIPLHITLNTDRKIDGSSLKRYEYLLEFDRIDDVFDSYRQQQTSESYSIEMCDNFLQTRLPTTVQTVSRFFLNPQDKWEVKLSKDIEELYRGHQKEVDESIKRYHATRDQSHASVSVDSNWSKKKKGKIGKIAALDKGLPKGRLLSNINNSKSDSLVFAAIINYSSVNLSINSRYLNLTTKKAVGDVPFP